MKLEIRWFRARPSAKAHAHLTFPGVLGPTIVALCGHVRQAHDRVSEIRIGVCQVCEREAVRRSREEVAA